MALRTESSSFANFAGAGVEAVSMSPRGPPSSVGASEIERLALSRRGSRSSEMGIITRSGAKREAANRGESSRGSAGAKGKGKEKVSGSSSAKRKSDRTSGPAAAQRDPDDEGGGDEESSDDEGDGDDDDRPQADTIQRRQMARWRKVMAIWMIHDPSFPSYKEFCSETLPRRPEASKLFRAQVVASLKYIRPNDDLTPLDDHCPVQGGKWSTKLADNMQRRWYLILNGYQSYCRGADGTNAEDTIDGIKLLFGAIEDVLGSFQNMENGAPQRLVDLLLQVLNTISDYPTDIRPAGAQPYAGGSQQFEYNLLLRFSAIHDNFFPCLEVVRRVGSRYKEQFLYRQAGWRTLYGKLYSVLLRMTPPTPGKSELMLHGLHDRLEQMEIVEK